MSEEHVAAVFGPKWVREETDWMRQRLQRAEAVTLALRRILIAKDPSLPNEYDGPAWWLIEEPWIPEHRRIA